MTDRRTALLDAAVQQIAAKGARGMRVEEVARAAGVSPALIYHHFGDRATLLQRALEHIGAWANVYTTPDAGTGREMVVQLLVDEIQDDPTVRTNSIAWGELRNTSFFDEALRPTVKELTDRWIDDVAQLIAQGQRDGTVADGHDAAALGIGLTGIVEGLSGRWLTGQMTTAEARRHVAALVTAVLDAPVPPEPPTTPVARRRRRA